MRYGDTTALDAISLDVHPGELFGLIGPDGAGKTSLFRVLATLLVPTSGQATVLGRDVVKDIWDLRRRIGYMAGRFSLYGDLSVDENLHFFASVFGTTLKRERERIEVIYRQLEPFRDRRAGALSGGMKQKLALCCALVHRPEILVLDEPTTGVDAVSRREFWDLLGRLREGGLTVLVSTPYMDEAGRCDRIALVQRGRVLALDRPEVISRSFDRPLLAVAAPDRLGALQALRGYPHTHSVQLFGSTLHFTDQRRIPVDEQAREVVAALEEQGLGPASAAPVDPTIEDVFMALMGAPEAAA